MGSNAAIPNWPEQVKPEIEQYILVRENQEITDFMLDGFNPDTTMPYPEAEIREQFEDEADNQQMMKDLNEYIAQRDTSPLPTTPEPTESKATASEPLEAQPAEPQPAPQPPARTT